MSEDVKGFMLFANQRRLLKRMTPEQKAALLDALFAFNDGEEVEPEDPMVDIAFVVISESIKRVWKKTETLRSNGRRSKAEANAGCTEQNGADVSKPEANESKGEANVSKPEQSISKTEQTRVKEKEEEKEREYIKKKEIKKERKPPENGLDTLLSAQPAEVAASLREFEAFRRAVKKPLTLHGMELAIGQLEKLAPGDIPTQVAIVEQSIMNGYQGLFPLKEGRPHYQRYSTPSGLSDAERRQAHNDAVCRQVAAELDAMGGPF